MKIAFSNISGINMALEKQPWQPPGTVPLLVSATVEDAAPDDIVLTYDQALDETSVPATTDYSIAGKTVSEVIISGETVTITVSEDFIPEEEILLSYSAGANPVRGLVGSRNAADLTDEEVENNILFDWEAYWATRTPSDLNLLIINATRIDLAWTNNGDEDYDGISIERGTDGINFVEIDTVIAGNTAYSNIGLTPDTHYYYRIRYYKGSNYSSYSNSIDIDMSFMTGILNQYRFDEVEGNLIDDISANNGTITGATQGITGIINKCYSFDGGNNVDLEDEHTILLTDNLTISVWYKPTASRVEYITYFQVDSYNRISIYQDLKFISFRLNRPGTVISVTFKNAITEFNKWYHILAERNRTTDTINVEVNNLPWHTPVNDSLTGSITTKIRIGKDVIGNIDELRIWKRLLSAPEKLALHNYNRGYNAGRFDNGKLIITFDDSKESLYIVGYPLLNIQGVKATFYLTSNKISTPTFFTWANVMEMYGGGMDIQDHGADHIGYAGKSEAEVIAMLEESNSDFIAQGLPVPLHNAYVGGDFTPESIAAYNNSGLRKTGRRVGPYTRIMPFTNKLGEMGAYGVDNINDAGIITLKAMMDEVLYQKGALIIYSHGVSVAGGVAEVAEAKLNEIIDYAQATGMDIITISELYTLMYP